MRSCQVCGEKLLPLELQGRETGFKEEHFNPGGAGNMEDKPHGLVLNALKFLELIQEGLVAVPSSLGCETECGKDIVE